MARVGTLPLIQNEVITGSCCKVIKDCLWIKSEASKGITTSYMELSCFVDRLNPLDLDRDLRDLRDPAM